MDQGMTQRVEVGTVWQGAAPAKTNLFLRVLAREESGYHQIESLFQALSLADSVRLELVPPREGITLSIAGVPPGSLGELDDNLMVRAARVYQQAVGPELGTWGLRMSLEKRIPHGAGLGGGSSDAATVLLGLQSLLGHPMSAGDLLVLAAGIGSDLPFFLAGGPLALVWGRGGRVLPLPALPSCPVVILQPERRIATPNAYATLAAHRRNVGYLEAGPRLMGGWGTWAEVAVQAENAFEDALAAVYPELPRLQTFLREVGAHWSLMSGSGSAVVGFFPDGIPDPFPWTWWDRTQPEGARPRMYAAQTLTKSPQSAAGG